MFGGALQERESEAVFEGAILKNGSLTPSQDEQWMELALEQASWAARRDEVPVGAVAVLEGEVLAGDHNRTIQLGDPTAHAEILVLREAARKLKNYRLLGVELFTTLEPCAMCAGALIWARVSRLVFGALDAKAGAVKSRARLLEPGLFNHNVAVRHGVLGRQGGALLQDFFRGCR